MDNSRRTLEEVQAEVRTICDEIVRQIERATELGRELTVDKPAEDYLQALEPMQPERFVGDGLVEVDHMASVSEYLAQLRRLAEMSPHEMQREWNRHQWRHLQDVSQRASRGLAGISDLLGQACKDENFIGLASLFRGVREASTSYVFLADRLEAYEKAEMGMRPDNVS